MFFQKLVDERSLGRGWVRVLIKADSAIAGFARCSIERLGLREPYLGRGGWQVASHFLDIEISVGRTENEFSFLLGPDVVRYMSAGSNYQLTMTDTNGAVLGVFPASWRGVPGYSPPVSAGSLGGTMPEPMAQLTTQVNNDEVKSNALVWGVDHGTVTEVESETTAVAEDEIIPEVIEPVMEAPRAAPGPIFKVDCPHGQHKIMSNMVFCPICSKPV
jgi:hypothetical protein